VFRHADSIEAASSEGSRRLEIEELEWSLENAPSSGGAVSFDGYKHPFKFSLDRQSSDRLMKIDFQWKWPTVAGTYCKICVAQKDATGDSVSDSVQIIGHRDGDALPNALFRVGSATETIHVTMSNAYGGSTAMIRKLSVSMLAPGTDTRSAASRPSPKARIRAAKGGNVTSNVRHTATVSTDKGDQAYLGDETEIALGSVGIIVADHSQLDGAVQEMVTHFDHYRRSSEAFAGQWFAMHHPNRTVAHLIGASGRSHSSSNSGQP
jgi:hypothetical protein